MDTVLAYRQIWGAPSVRRRVTLNELNACREMLTQQAWALDKASLKARGDEAGRLDDQAYRVRRMRRKVDAEITKRESRARRSS